MRRSIAAMAASTATALTLVAGLGVVAGPAAFAAPPGGPAPAAWAPPTLAASALAQVHTAGRTTVADGVARYSWPGVYFEGEFRGTGIGVILNDPYSDYAVQIDGATVATWVTPAPGTRWVNGLANGRHRVRLVKRNESPWATSAFGGFVAATGGAILAKPAARARQIEFIGDSHTAGYGNMSNTRDCSGDQVNRTTNADLTFGAVTAKRLNADYQLNAYSGLGMVRNYNGGRPELTYRTFADRALLNVDGDVWRNPGTWRPQLVVVGLGINDFSTAINPGEPWTPESRNAGYRAAYHGFLDKLRARYGRTTVIVVVSGDASTTTELAKATQQIVRERNSRGDDRVRHFSYPETGLDLLGCHWHPSLHDHQLIADRLHDVIGTLPVTWRR